MVSGNPSALGTKLHEKERDDQEHAGERGEVQIGCGDGEPQSPRPDVRFAVKELCRDMARPTNGSCRKMKKLARCLKDQPKVVHKIKLQSGGIGNEATAVVDLD